MLKKIAIWALALVITSIAAIFQHRTASTYPESYKIKIGSDIYKGELLRSHAGSRECLIEIPIDDKEITGYIHYKSSTTNEEYKQIRLMQYRNELCGILPHHPPAGKLQYYIELVKEGRRFYIKKDDPVVIRFQGDVPAYVNIPHVLLLFLSMFFSTLSGLYILFKQDNYRKYADLAFYTLIAGGIVFGLLAEKFAFDRFWSGIPFSFNFFDNKFLLVFLFWLWAFLANRKKYKPMPVLIACIMTLVIFSIPHNLINSIKY